MKGRNEGIKIDYFELSCKERDAQARSGRLNRFSLITVHDIPVETFQDVNGEIPDTTKMRRLGESFARISKIKRLYQSKSERQAVVLGQVSNRELKKEYLKMGIGLKRGMIFGFSFFGLPEILGDNYEHPENGMFYATWYLPRAQFAHAICMYMIGPFQDAIWKQRALGMTLVEAVMGKKY